MQPTKKPRAPIHPFVKDVEEGITVVPLVFDDACKYCLVPSSTLYSAFSETEACQATKPDLLSRGYGYINANMIVILSDAATEGNLMGTWAVSTSVEGGRH
ncbi:hypothetical protein GGI17_002765 [Coemansia sp. S146]|nr:hypothetical protein GGI17_002765 [Coemansia sp. S146]